SSPDLRTFPFTHPANTAQSSAPTCRNAGRKTEGNGTRPTEAARCSAPTPRLDGLTTQAALRFNTVGLPTCSASAVPAPRSAQVALGTFTVLCHVSQPIVSGAAI